MSTMRSIKVENMKSPYSGNPIMNQFIISTPEGRYFQSYDSIIAFIDNRGQTYLDTNCWDYSSTTGKYRNQFLGMGIGLTRKLINDGKIILTDLN